MASSTRPSDPANDALEALVRDVLGPAGLAALGEFLARQRWFAGRGRVPQRLRLVDWAVLEPAPALLLALVEADGERYYLPLALRPAGDSAEVPAERNITRRAAWVVFDAHWHPAFGRRLALAATAGRVLPASAGRFVCHWTGDAKRYDEVELAEMRALPFGGEQSNTSVMLGAELIVKSIRHPWRGLNPEFEVVHFLTTRTSFAHTPGLAGWVDYEGSDGAVTTVCLLQPFVENQGDGWQYALDHLRGLVDALALEPPPSRSEAAEARLRELAGDFIEEMRRLGTVTGGLHAALASDPATPAFAPEPITSLDADRWSRAIVEEARDVFAEAQRRAPTLSAADRAALAAVAERAPVLEGGAIGLSMLADGHTHKIRHHGDYHLGQVLKTPGGFVVIDFEGEPARAPEARRDKHCALRDVAGMLRSFGYAAHAGLAGRPPADREALAGWLGAWERLVGEAFWRGYLGAVRESPAPVVPVSEEDARRACAVFELAKAIYELGYELSHRPDWVSIPLAGISRILRRVMP